MIAVHLKKLNPKKKCLILNDQNKSLYEFKSFLKHQTSLNIFHLFKMTSRLNKNDLSKYKYSDICMLNLNHLLDELNFQPYIKIEDYSCIIIDESVLNNSLFDEFINMFYIKTLDEYKPRLICFISSFMPNKKLKKLTELIQANVYKPIVADHSKQFIFCATSHHDHGNMIDLCNQFIEPFVRYLTQKFHFNLKTQSNTLIDFIINEVLKENNIHANQKRYSIAKLLLEIANAIDIIDIVGISEACVILRNYINDVMNPVNNVWNKKEIKSMQSFCLNLNICNSFSNKYAALFSILLDNINKNLKTIIYIQNKKTVVVLNNFLNRDQNFKHLRPKFLNNFNKDIIDQFKSGYCKLLVLSLKNYDLQSNQVILFNDSWREPSILPNSNCKHFVICSNEEKNNYDQLIKNERDMTNQIESMISEHINQSYIQQIKHLETYKKESIKEKDIEFLVQIFIDESEENKMHEIILSIEKHYINIEKSHESFATELDLFPDLQVYDIKIKSSYNYIENDEIQFKLDIVKDLTENLKNSAFHLYTKSNDNLNDMSVKISSLELGNLVTPFKFVTNNSKFNTTNKCKLVVNFNIKSLQIISANYKFEIWFNAIDHLICFDNKKDHLLVYIPCKRAPLLFKAIEKDLETDEIEKDHRTCPNLEQTCWTFKLKCNINDQTEIFKKFQQIQGIKLFFCSILNTELKYTLNDLRKDFKRASFKLKYILEVFISQNDYFLDGKIDSSFTDIINKMDPHDLTPVLERLTLVLQRSSRYQSSIVDILKNILLKYNKPIDVNPTSLDDRIVLIRRATVTPLRIIYHFPEPFFSNRVIRNYDPNKFIRLRFCDEDMRKLNLSQTYIDMSELYERIKKLLKNGLNVCDNEYLFLAMSSSQLREHGCWLCKENNDNITADDVRNWMGSFNNIKCIGKYAARLGQSLSSSIETFETKQFTTIPDIMSNDSKYCFSDGIGKISFKKAKEICNKYEIYASTFQIRFAGFKGVLTSWPNMNENEIQFRPSMKKFDCVNINLDVLNIAEYIPCFLNRQVIVILSALGKYCFLYLYFLYFD